MSAACVGAVGLAAIWAFEPLDEPVIDTTPPVTRQDASERRPLDVAAFSAPIWYTPPPPVEPKPVIVEQPRRLPPFNLELIAIVEAGGSSEAVFYDPGQDTLIQVAIGQRLGDGRVVDAIDTEGVQIREPNGVRTVALEQGGP
ncbi:MAG TPA: hypothetical protein ENK57_03640 [Polyangiaceae bacterium]|nr:hypothetical protein [Polyangiaceae bacterium]